MDFNTAKEEEFGFSGNYFLAKEMGSSGKKAARKLSDINVVDEHCGTIRLFMHNFTHQQHELPCKDDLRPVKI